MEPTKINCYLCSNHEAKKYEPVGASRNITVECPECTFYKISPKVIEWHFDKGEVSPEQKKRISLHVQNYYSYTGEAYLLDMDSILQFPK
jgi:hypothetical protein